MFNLPLSSCRRQIGPFLPVSLALAVAVLTGYGSALQAQVVPYTDEGSFNAATAKFQFVEDTFEGIAPASGEVDFDDSSLNIPTAPITYAAHNSLAGNNPHGIAIADANYDQGRLALNGSSSIAAFFDIEEAPTTVTMSFNQPVTAFGLNLGMVNFYGATDPRSQYPHTDHIDIQLYTQSTDPDTFGEEVPVGDVYHAGFPIKGYVGFVSTVAITSATLVQVHPQDYYDSNGYPIEDYFQMAFDNVRVGQAPTLPTVTVTGSSPDADAGTGQVGDFVLSLSAVSAVDLHVAYTVKGSAEPGVDYVALKGTAKIKAGKTSKKINVSPLGDLGGASKKAVSLTLQPGTGYVVGTPGKVKVKITDAHMVTLP